MSQLVPSVWQYLVQMCILSSLDPHFVDLLLKILFYFEAIDESDKAQEIFSGQGFLLLLKTLKKSLPEILARLLV